MKKMQLHVSHTLTFEEACNKYLDDCRERNLREGTINHYRQSYTQFYKYFSPDMPVTDLTEARYKQYVIHLRGTLDNDVSINSYLRDMITTLHFLMREGYLPCYPVKAIKVDKTSVETYSDEELKLLLKKPNLQVCKFIEYIQMPLCYSLCGDS